MKIDIRYIIRDHLVTLRNAETNKVSLSDYILFYLIPFIVSGITFWAGLQFKKPDVYNVSITFFGIFIALLLNLQVAIFAILQRKWHFAQDDPMRPFKKEKFEHRKILLSELNANLSYLVLFCCLALFVSLVLFVWEWNSGLGPAAMVFVYLHFLFTLIMVVKRSHVLFQSEYGEESEM